MNREQQRFQAAVAAMQGYLASYSGLTNAMPGESEVAKNCVGYADALLAELDRTKPEPETPQPDADGWIPHVPGNPAPEPKGMVVLVKFRNGEDSGISLKVSSWYWESGNYDYDIVAWKPA